MSPDKGGELNATTEGAFAPLIKAFSTQTLIHQSGLTLKTCFSSLPWVARPSDASSGYAFMRAFPGSNIAERAATLTGKRSFMYCTCSLVPAAA